MQGLNGLAVLTALSVLVEIVVIRALYVWIWG